MMSHLVSVFNQCFGKLSILKPFSEDLFKALAFLSEFDTIHLL